MNREREQLLIDIMFEIAVRVQMGQLYWSSREAAANYVAETLRGCGFDTSPMGMSWGVLKEDGKG